jgi:cytochrome c oxidase subunit 2
MKRRDAAQRLYLQRFRFGKQLHVLNDLLYLFIVAVSAFFAILVIALIVVFTLKYRRQNPDAVGVDNHGSLTLEIVWTFIPFVLAMAMLGWGAAIFFKK